MADRRVEYVRLCDLREAPRNPKQHAEDDIAGSITEFGFAELPLIDDRTGLLVAGHGRRKTLLARQAEGKPPPDGVTVADDGEWLIPVNRGWSSANDAAAEAYLAASNRLPEKGGWDERQLGALLGDVRDADRSLLAATGFTDADIAAMLGTTTVLPATGPGDNNGGGSSHSDGPHTARGDLWALGPHRLLCGDATNPIHVDQLLAAIDSEPDLVHTAPPTPNGDDEDRDRAPADTYRLLDALLPDALHIWWGAQSYAETISLPDSPCWLVWDTKARTGNEAHLAWTNEHGGRIRLYTEPGRIKKRSIAPSRPTELAAWAMDVVDKDRFRTVVLDPFARTGWTLLGAHSSGRVCAALELSPVHVDTICRRFQQDTGTLPERIHPDGGREPVNFDF